MMSLPVQINIHLPKTLSLPLWMSFFIFNMSSLGCGGTTPSKYYTLIDAMPPSSQVTHKSTGSVDAAVQSSPVLGIGPISIPERLDRLHLITREGEHHLRIHTKHRWGAPLRDQLLSRVESELTQKLTRRTLVAYPWERAWRPDHQLTIDVRRLEGELGGEVHVELVWRLIKIDQEQVLDQGRFTTSVSAQHRAGGKAHTAYVRAIASSLSLFVETIVPVINQFE